LQFPPRPITNPKIKADGFEISHLLLNLIAEEQFGESATEEASMHLQDLCEMQKIKNVENDIVKHKLFSSSLIGEAKDLLLSLSTASINSGMILKKPS
jgi:hypothetical protein